LASTTIIVPGPERAVHISALRTDGRARDDVRTAAISGARPETRGDDGRASSRQFDLARLPRIAFGEPSGALPFLAQQLAQEEPDAPPSSEAGIAPALRLSALRAYGTASESTIEFLSPTPLYDFRV
jgi:hypothetical protein